MALLLGPLFACGGGGSASSGDGGGSTSPDGEPGPRVDAAAGSDAAFDGSTRDSATTEAAPPAADGSASQDGDAAALLDAGSADTSSPPMPDAGPGAPFSLTFSSMRGSGGQQYVWRWRSDTGALTEVPGTAGWDGMSFSFDGLSAVGGGTLSLYGWAAQAASAVSLPDPTNVVSPVLSPDKSTIVFSSNARGSTLAWLLWSVPAAGGTPTQLTAVSADKTRQDMISCFRPDGQLIVFDRQYLGGASPGSSAIATMKPDGTAQTILIAPTTTSQVSSPSYRRDSAQITYLRCGLGASSAACDIEVSNADGTSPVQLTHAPSAKQSPVFSLDGATIYYVDGETVATSNLARVDVATSTVTTVVAGIQGTTEAPSTNFGVNTLTLRPE